jgi:hypothetical protein
MNDDPTNYYAEWARIDIIRDGKLFCPRHAARTFLLNPTCKCDQDAIKARLNSTDDYEIVSFGKTSGHIFP